MALPRALQILCPLTCDCTTASPSRAHPPAAAVATSHCWSRYRWLQTALPVSLSSSVGTVWHNHGETCQARWGMEAGPHPDCPASRFSLGPGQRTLPSLCTAVLLHRRCVCRGCYMVVIQRAGLLESQSPMVCNDDGTSPLASGECLPLPRCQSTMLPYLPGLTSSPDDLNRHRAHLQLLARGCDSKCRHSGRG